MATRYFPVSVAVPAHLDHMTDTELIGIINGAIAINTAKEPLVLVPMTFDQFVVARPDAADGIARATKRASRARRRR